MTHDGPDHHDTTPDPIRSVMMADRPATGPDPQWHPLGAEDGAGARRRRVVQRSALVAIVAVVGLAVALAVGRAPGVLEANPATEPIPAAGPEPAATPIAVRLAVGAIVAVVVGLIGLAATPGRRGIERVALLTAVAAVAYPTWTYANFTRSVGEVERRAVTLEGLSIQSVERTWDPLTAWNDPLVTVTVTPGTGPPVGPDLSPRSATERDVERDIERDVERDVGAAIEVLEAQGFEYNRFTNSHNRDIPDTGPPDGSWSHRDEVVVRDGPDPTTILEIRRWPGTERRSLPPALLLATFLMAGATVLTAASTRLRSALGWATMVIVAAQVALVTRALLATKRHIDDYQAAAGPIDRDRVLARSAADDPTSELGRLFDDVTNAADDLYPVGSGAYLLLLAPWLVACMITLAGHRRIRFAFLAGGLGFAISAIAWSAPFTGIMLDILE